MSKLCLWSIIFLVIAIIAFVSLTMSPNIIILKISVFAVGILGACICTIVRVVHKSKKNK